MKLFHFIKIYSYFKTRDYIPPLFVLFFLFLCTHCADLPLPKKPNVPPNNLIVAITTDFVTGFVSAMAPDGSRLYQDILPVHSDAVLREHEGELYVINRLGADNLTRIKPTAGYLREYELSLGRRSNPHDIAFVSSDLAAISLYDATDLLFVNYRQGKIVGRLSLAAYSDADGLPEMSSLYYHSNGFLYVVLQRLNRHGAGIWPPSGDSLLLKINPFSRSVVDSFTIPLSNPISRLRYHDFRDSLIMAAPAFFGVNYQLDGGVVEFNLTTEAFSVLISETELGEEVTDCLLVSSSLGFLLTQNNSFITRIKAFDPVTKNILATLASSQNMSGFFADMLLHSPKLYVADRNYHRPGVRIFDINTLEEETGTPHYLGLPPFNLDMLP